MDEDDPEHIKHTLPEDDKLAQEYEKHHLKEA